MCVTNKLWGDNMEEVKEIKSVVTSYRLSEDTKEKLKKQLSELGMTQEQYFNRVVSMMELENVKQNNIFAVDTVELQELTQRINNIFIGLCEQGNSFLENKDTELGELKVKYKDMLSDKESLIIEQKQELQEVYNNLVLAQNENKENESKLLSIKIEYTKQLEQLEGNLEDKKLIVEEYKGKNDMLLSDLAELKQYKVEVDEYKKLLADYQAKNIDLSNSNKDKEYSINQLNESLEKLKQDNQREIESIKRENQLNIKLAVAEVKDELSNKLSQEQMRHNKEIEEYQSKYRELLEQLEIKKKSGSPKVVKEKIIKGKE